MIAEESPSTQEGVPNLYRGPIDLRQSFGLYKGIKTRTSRRILFKTDYK